LEYLLEYLHRFVLVRNFVVYTPMHLTLSLISAPLLSNILPHLQTLTSFITHTLPKPLLASLFYRLIILHLASRILPSIGADSWENDVGVVDGGWDGRPVGLLGLFCSVFIAHSFLDFTAYPYPSHLPPIHLHHSVFSSTVSVASLPVIAHH